MGRIQTLGVLTGGGDCPGLNAVIRAVVKTAVNKYKINVVGIEDGFEGLIKPGKTRYLSEKDVEKILPRGGTILGTTNRGNPFQYKVVRNGKVATLDYSDRVIKSLKKLGIDALAVVGGDGSLRIALDFFKKGVRVVGVPKTIDNDLEATEVTFGFDSAINTAKDAIDKLHDTAESHHRVIVVEVMGRNAGWIALEAGMAGGADIILLPEIPFDIEKVCHKIRQRDKAGMKYSIVVAAEGAVPLGGNAVFVHSNDPCAPERLGGIGALIANEVNRRTKHETRVTVLGHIQRGGSPTAFDRNLGTRFGAAAVRLAMEGQFGKMVCLKSGKIDSVELEKAVGNLKLVKKDCDYIKAATDSGIIFGF